MDFVIDLLLSLSKKNILSKVYMNEIFRLHGVPLSIIPGRDPHLTSRFWKQLYKTKFQRRIPSPVRWPI
ncbi:Transposon Ty3-I Gag-Pol polyprotein [Gossypium australe]|uniref:Transposon Ty3-I Gag-Pol polyprotein n=1 Tax=Gossypium australe TaxID=47621 RepID=A0A5B6WXX3_9ROSI|nr:Transposon Ty3-I Gag-Pol polyprotein [Gossypium australe]